MEPDGSHGALTCSFCGKGQGEVQKFIAGPSVFICDECIGLCNDILAEEEITPGKPELPPPPEAQQAAFDLVQACKADPKVPRLITELALGLWMALREHLKPPEG